MGLSETFVVSREVNGAVESVQSGMFLGGHFLYNSLKQPLILSKVY